MSFSKNVNVINKVKFDTINNIIDGNSVRLRYKYFFNHYKDVLKQIENFCEKIKDLPFIQQIWHWVNDCPDYYLCEKCDNRTSFNRNWIDGYRKYCSAKCTQSNEDTKEKRKLTNIEKYGVDNVAKSEDIKEKMSKTNIDRYGFKSSFQNEDVKSKYRETINKKYGVDHYFKTDEFKLKNKKYYLEKWGVYHQLSVDEIKERIKNTCLQRYGVTTYLNTEHSRSCVKTYNRSSYEREIITWLESFGLEVIHSNRDIINPQLIDIYLPKFNLCIEFNGLYWHSESFKDKKYHLDKTVKCNEGGFRLIHIWEDDWMNRKDIIKSILLNCVGLTDNKIYARKCIIKEVNNEDTSLFLNNNHIQGYTKFSSSIGLYHNDELVSLMSFGWRSTNGKKEYELIRFCNKININVIGSASKLFKYFMSSNKDVDNITSYSDISMFTGGLYKKLGFDYIRRSDVNYWWVVNGVRKHRFNYNKKKLVKLGYDPLKTEVEIMHELGNYRIFGCGQDKWVYYKTKQ